MTINKERITPEIASEILATNIDNNRSVSVRRVQMYEHDMLTGAWVDNGETIKIDRQGRLVDGQHRLKAIALSGVTQWLWVARGVPNDAFNTIDVGFARTPRQIFRMSGDPIKMQTTACAVAAFAFKLFRGVSKATQSQMGEFVEANRETLEWLYSTVKSANKCTAYYLLCAIAMHIHGVTDTEISWFIEGATHSRFDPQKPANAFKFCVQAENARKASRSATSANVQNITRCAYSYVHNLQRLSQKEDAYPLTMDDKYKIVKGEAHES